MYKIVEFSHILITDFLKRLNKDAPICIDATCGMGNDTLHIAKVLNNKGTIHAYDIQEVAILETTKLISNNKFDNVIYHNNSHENIDINNINLAIYNLGYLPGHDKNLTTLPESSLNSIKQVLKNVANEYLIIIVLYPGHETGLIESKLIDDFCFNLKSSTYLVSKYQNYNRPTSPYIITISKNKK